MSHPQKARRHTYRWLSGLRYQKHTLSWLACVEDDVGTRKRFVYVTDIEACFDNVIELTTSGRMRFKIEGFNALKNGAYELIRPAAGSRTPVAGPAVRGPALQGAKGEELGMSHPASDWG